MPGRWRGRLIEKAREINNSRLGLLILARLFLDGIFGFTDRDAVTTATQRPCGARSQLSASQALVSDG